LTLGKFVRLSRTGSRAHKRHSSVNYPPTSNGLVSTTFGYIDPTFKTYSAWYMALIKKVVSTGIAQKSYDWMGYRKYGLRLEDILVESPEVGRALAILPKEVLADRDDRIKQAFVLTASGDILPPEKQTKPEEDLSYLAPYLVIVVQEARDRKHFRPR